MKAQLKLLIATILLITLIPRSGRSQSYILDWGSSFTPAWNAGNTSGSANNVGGSNVSITVNMTISGLGGFSSGFPEVNNNNSNAALFEVEGSTDAIEIDQDLNNLSSFSVITFNFSRPVQNLTFGISDVDRSAGSTPWDYVDYLTITGTGSSGLVNPTITKYNPSATIVDVTANTANGNITAFGGNASSLNQGNPDQNGTIFVDFGTAGITSITLNYGNPPVPGLRANPRLQAMAIGNLSFQPVASLPASFLGFGAQVKNNTVALNWKTGSLANSGYISVERSKNGSDWNNPPQGIPNTLISSKTEYQVIDKNPLPGISFYRLKESTNDGFVYYSKTLRVSLDNSTQTSIKTYPNPFQNELKMELNWPQTEFVSLKIINSSGQIVKQQIISLQKGFQVISVEGLGKFGKGNYLLSVENRNGINRLNKYISQQ